MTLAKVTCLDCGWTWTKNCGLGYEAEKYFYMNYRPECTSCKQDPGSWKVEEVIEVRLPLTEDEISLFSLTGGIK